MIRVPQVRVVDEDGSQLGVLATGEALRLAQERGYDLVEVAPMASPPVARLLDYGQFKYEQARRDKEARRHQRSVEFKEIRIRPKIGTGDFDTKVRRAIQFLEEGDRIKVAVQFRGRELTHAFIGRDLLNKFADQIKDHGAVERQPLLEGKSMSIVVASTHKPKPLAGSPEATTPAHGAQGAPDRAVPAPAAAQSEPQATPVAAATSAATPPAAPAAAPAATPTAAEAPASVAPPASEEAPTAPTASGVANPPATDAAPSPAARPAPAAKAKAATTDAAPAKPAAAPRRTTAARSVTAAPRSAPASTSPDKPKPAPATVSSAAKPSGE